MLLHVLIKSLLYFVPVLQPHLWSSVIAIMSIPLFKNVVIFWGLIPQIRQNVCSHVHCLYQGRYRIRCDAVECSQRTIHFVLGGRH